MNETAVRRIAAATGSAREARTSAPRRRTRSSLPVAEAQDARGRERGLRAGGGVLRAAARGRPVRPDGSYEARGDARRPRCRSGSAGEPGRVRAARELACGVAQAERLDERRVEAAIVTGAVGTPARGASCSVRSATSCASAFCVSGASGLNDAASPPIRPRDVTSLIWGCAHDVLPAPARDGGQRRAPAEQRQENVAAHLCRSAAARRTL